MSGFHCEAEGLFSKKRKEVRNESRTGLFLCLVFKCTVACIVLVFVHIRVTLVLRVTASLLEPAVSCSFSRVKISNAWHRGNFTQMELKTDSYSWKGGTARIFAFLFYASLHMHISRSYVVSVPLGHKRSQFLRTWFQLLNFAHIVRLGIKFLGFFSTQR